MSEPGDVEPRWFTVALTVVLVGVSVSTTLGLALAILGAFRPWVFVALVVPVSLALLALWRFRDRRKAPATFADPTRRELPRRTTRSASIATVIALLLAVGSVAWNANHRGEHVVADRDPGAYVSKGRWLARAGTLDVELHRGVFGTTEGLGFGSAATTVLSGDRLQVNFASLSAIPLAVGYWLGGEAWMFSMPAVLGGLGLVCLYALGLRVVRSPWLALLATATLAVSIPQVWFTRDVYSEALTQPLILGGLWLLAVSRHRRSALPALLAGLVLGASVANRIDGQLVLGAAAAVFLVDSLRSGANRRRVGAHALACFAGAALPVAVGTLDLATRTGRYLSLHSGQYRNAWTASAAIVGVCLLTGLVGPHLAGAWRRARPWRTVLATTAGATLSAALLFLWIGRRHVSRPSLASYGVAVPSEYTHALERAAGWPAAGIRSYAELSVTWQTWYFGIPTVVLAIVGLGLLTAVVLRGRRLDALGLVVGFVCIGVVYLWSPSIFPDHPWAMRRFLPLVTPALLLGAAFTLAAVLSLARTRVQARLGAAVVLLVAIGVVGVPVTRTARIAEMSNQRGWAGTIDAACEAVPDDGALLVVDDRDARSLYPELIPQALRSFCGVPVASVEGTLDPVEAEAIAAHAADRGKRLFAVAASPATLDALGASDITRLPAGRDSTMAEVRIDRAPRRYGGKSFPLSVGEIPAPGRREPSVPALPAP